MRPGFSSALAALRSGSSAGAAAPGGRLRAEPSGAAEGWGAGRPVCKSRRSRGSTGTGRRRRGALCDRMRLLAGAR